MPLVGTVLQIAVTVGLVALLGFAFDWPAPRVLLIGFAASLSSTAVILKLLKDSGQLESRTGQNVLGILLAQDIAIVPMVVVLAVAKKNLHLPFKDALRRDHELQVFAALAICFGLAVLSGAFYLSTALGAFVGGILVGSTRETSWFHQSLDRFGFSSSRFSLFRWG